MRDVEVYFEPSELCGQYLADIKCLAELLRFPFVGRITGAADSLQLQGF